MSSSKDATFKVTIDQEYTWDLRWKDVREIERQISTLRDKDVTWMKIRQELNDWTIQELSIIVWAGIRKDAPNMTPDVIMEKAPFTLQDEFVGKFCQAIMAATPEYLKKRVEELQRESLSTTPPQS